MASSSVVGFDVITSHLKKWILVQDRGGGPI
jgi:hypothetical protein